MSLTASNNLRQKNGSVVVHHVFYIPRSINASGITINLTVCRNPSYTNRILLRFTQSKVYVELLQCKRPLSMKKQKISFYDLSDNKRMSLRDDLKPNMPNRGRLHALLPHAKIILTWKRCFSTVCVQIQLQNKCI